MPLKTIILIALIIGAVALLALLIVILLKKKKGNSTNVGNITFDEPKGKEKKGKKEKGSKKGPKKGPKKGKRVESESMDDDIFTQFNNMETASTLGGEEEEEEIINIHAKYSNHSKDERAIAKELLQKLFDGVSVNSTTKILASVTEPAIIDFANAIYTIQINELKRQFKAVSIGEPVELSRKPSGRDELITIKIPVEYKDFLLTKDGKLVGSRDKVFQKDIIIVLKKNMDNSAPVLICNINL